MNNSIFQSPIFWSAIIAAVFSVINGILAHYWFKKNRKIISTYNIDLEKNKSNLERQNYAFQSSLNTEIEKFKIQYGLLYSKRLDVLENIHNMLIRINNLVSVLCKENHNDNDDIIFNENKDIITEFFNYYTENKIYMSEDLSKLIYASFSMITSDLFNSEDKILWNKLSKEFSKEQILFFQTFFKTLKHKAKENNITIATAIKSVEDEFRNLIGINN